MSIGHLVEQTKADLERYDRGDLWYPATRQRVADLLDAVEQLQHQAEAKGYELEAAARELARLRP